jgi:hypothetical protein
MPAAVDPTELTPLQVQRRLRHWARASDSHVYAAVELLLGHGVWLRRAEFLTAAVRVHRTSAWITWTAARAAFDAGHFDAASSTERAVLDLAIALGQDRYRLSRMDTSNATAIATAVALAAGLLDPTPKGTHTP